MLTTKYGYFSVLIVLIVFSFITLVCDCQSVLEKCVTSESTS